MTLFGAKGEDNNLYSPPVDNRIRKKWREEQLNNLRQREDCAKILRDYLMSGKLGRCPVCLEDTLFYNSVIDVFECLKCDRIWNTQYSLLAALTNGYSDER